MDGIVDLDLYPLDRPGSPEWQDLVARVRGDLDAEGMFDLPGFLLSGAREAALAALVQKFEAEAFLHAREHNIYFRKEVPELAPDHQALTRFQTVNRTLCADQMAGSPLVTLHRDPRFAAFLAAAMGKAVLHPMGDPLAAVNAMAYGPGEALNWHFDRSEFTTTILLQAPEAGGLFEYRRDLRSESDPNYDGVARLLRGEDPELRSVQLDPGSLNVFRGRNTAHRVTPVEGATSRVIAVFSFFDRPDVQFSPEERVGFYGRAEPLAA